MAGLIPLNRLHNGFARTSTGFEDFNSMLDDFFNDSWMLGRSLTRDTFKIDIEETEAAYCIEAELPGTKKEAIDLRVEAETLCVCVNCDEAVNDDGKNYIHRERRVSTMSRRIRLANAKLDEITAKLEDGVLTVLVPKIQKANSQRKIAID